MMRSQWLTVVAGLLSLAPPAWARSVVTSYTYNADGALAAASVATDGGPARQSYFVWDNFTPAASTLGRGEGVAMERYIGRWAFAGRTLVDLGVGGGQSVAAGFDGGGRRRFAPRAFAENMGVTFAAMAVGRVGLGIGYQPYNLTAAEAERMADRRVGGVTADGVTVVGESLVFRGRHQLPDSSRAFTTPLLEWAQRGRYAESLVAVSRESVLTARLDLATVSIPADVTSRERGALGAVLAGGRYRFVGVHDAQDVTSVFDQARAPASADVIGMSHVHVAGILQRLGQVHGEPRMEPSMSDHEDFE